ncbi:Metallophosphoesterase OS=Tsukamurella paurometabola (strain ATCC 8368 / DSM / CCUG 35730 /CIP 100753 / JCM 10117 / KCTC 9821 / NBRC 16120 / NCIMB 702349/ NCTC 13040) OX=521096 GN=Tpau_1217 PE=4 SV=1 [Tsukamurella paurometabola]|uniref:Nuclease SbcCD subunit D n=1 Tax=Tsukamurella paurometabola (strain ATCC 8368 / DSM 20162 / CCUG 35730 / CIP 100753 / JCM 10117 / KCTC 9821 / NBRC 16120 / NCIMB 702349 / NCTC 13040) TaxID=521096 RepID=D5UW41_TSUPD|nr:metallophosphoesterase [Tsukamurella paurometabola]ADG77848.1 metallophosphoesterase [Tsukamurella paurometabola DSM 20162]SUP29016.1 exonuclease subunit SbcD [Tsukamurella paurometabola]
MRFVHTADWQLGMTRHFLDADAQARFTDARLDAISRLGAVAAEQRAEFVVVCGDVFEDNRLAPAVIARSLDRVATIGVPVYLLPGNHDPLDAASIYTSEVFARHRPENVIVLDTPGVHMVRPGVELLAAPWFSKHPASDPLTEAVGAAQAPAAGVIRIAVGHGGALPVGAQDQRLIDIAAVGARLDAGELRYVALGDRHSVTEVRPGVWYSGAPEVTNFDHKERDSGSVLVVDVPEDGGPAEVTPVRVGSWRFAAREYPLSGDRDVTAAVAALSGLPDKDRTVVKVGFTGTVGLAAKAALDAELEALRARFAAVELWQRKTDLAVLPGDDELESLDLTGPAAAAAEELLGVARSGGDRAADASGALALLYRLTRPEVTT